MKVFLSWSGETSHSVAKVLRDWLPQVIQIVDPYVSSEDIDKGARWSSDIAGQLDASSYGIICLTTDNISAPWINFEAGALGKSVDKSRVSPFLFRLQRHEVQGPLVQYQFTVAEKEDVLKLVRSLNVAAGEESLPPSRLETSFEVWWPHLETALSDIPVGKAEKSAAKRDVADQVDQLAAMTAELLDLTRNNSKALMAEHHFALGRSTVTTFKEATATGRVIQRALPRELKLSHLMGQFHEVNLLAEELAAFMAQQRESEELDGDAAIAYIERHIYHLRHIVKSAITGNY